ncbi:MAG: SEL1-like repeat protein, partial [Ignavibacteriae bacterium]|nr:SEL1-like repeat protein [Ignavibacteriota bacterium]
MGSLANLYKGELKDLHKAEEYYLKAVEAGDVVAMFNLALLYHLEFKNIPKAEQYYLMAAENEHVRAMF